MLKNTSPNANVGSVTRARRYRREMTLPEVLLWRILKTRPGNLKFRRQHPSGPYVLDFFCNDARLAIEIDGRAHDMGDRPQCDDARDTFLARNAIETLRIPASDVLGDPTAVVERILALARSRLPLHHPAAPDGPPPRD